MKQKMTWGGIGPKMAVFSIPYFILAVILTVIRPDFLQMSFLSPIAGYLVGGVILAGGLVFYVMLVGELLMGLKKQRLMTKGVFGLSRNPLYASFILFFIPGLGIFFRSWLVFAGAVVMYANFKLLIEEEYKVLRNNFGKKYAEYEKKVNELVPLPKLIFGKGTLPKSLFAKKKKKAWEK